MFQRERRLRSKSAINDKNRLAEANRFKLPKGSYLLGRAGLRRSHLFLIDFLDLLEQIVGLLLVRLAGI